MSEAVAVSATRSRVGMAIRNASLQSGVDFDYLYQQARVESGLNPTARARTSSATGLYQFIDQTWLATVDRHGARLGYGWAADAIHRDANGRFRIADPGMRQQIMNLRNQPEAAATMAAAFASDNAGYLRARIGREPEPVDLYLAHFLGPAGAARFLARHAQNPDAPAAPEMPVQAAANRGVFYRNGEALSFDAIRTRFASRFQSDGGPTAPAPGSATEFKSGTIGTLADVEAALRAMGPASSARSVQAERSLAEQSPAELHRLAAIMLAEMIA